MTEEQIPKKYIDTINDVIASIGKPEIQNSTLSKNTQYPIQDTNKWLCMLDVVCVYVDMINSTKISKQVSDKHSLAKIYQTFTEVAIRLFDAFEAPYIDVKGDGVFALFNHNQPYRAFASAITFKTYIETFFNAFINENFPDISTGAHIGIDQDTLFVRRFGLKEYLNRDTRANEVWIGTAVNMASKLASICEPGQILVSDRYFNNIQDEHVVLSCGCKNGKYTGEKVPLWCEISPAPKDIFIFDKAHVTSTYWCTNHGAEYCEKILKLDPKE